MIGVHLHFIHSPGKRQEYEINQNSGDMTLNSNKSDYDFFDFLSVQVNRLNILNKSRKNTPKFVLG